MLQKFVNYLNQNFEYEWAFLSFVLQCCRVVGKRGHKKITMLTDFSWLNFALKEKKYSFILSPKQNTASEVAILKKNLINSCLLQARLPVGTTCP